MIYRLLFLCLRRSYENMADETEEACLVREEAEIKYYGVIK